MKYYCDENILGIRICYKESIKNNRIESNYISNKNPYKLKLVYEYCDEEDYMINMKEKIKELKIKDLRKIVFYTLHKFYRYEDNICFMEWKRNFHNIPFSKLKKLILN